MLFNEVASCRGITAKVVKGVGGDCKHKLDECMYTVLYKKNGKEISKFHSSSRFHFLLCMFKTSQKRIIPKKFRNLVIICKVGALFS